MSKWDFVPFSSLYLIPSKNGLSRPKRVRGSGYKMINMGELFAYDRINNPDMELVPMNEREKEIYTVQPGDLLFARQSLVAEGAGKCSIVLRTPETTTFESHLIRARLNPEKAVPLFYYYYFTSPIGKSTVRSLVMQVAAAGIRGSELAQLPVPLPSLPTQRKIAAILSAYDDLIENNTRRIKILEEMAQLLYREWFVKFRFPGHEKVRMVESELGPIPEGWEVKDLFSVADVKYGFPFKSKQFNNDSVGYRVVRIRDLNDRFTNTYTTELASSDYLVNNGDILVGMDGDFHICKWSRGKAYLNQRIVRFRVKEPNMTQYYLYFAIKEPIAYLNSVIVGTTVAHLSDKDLRAIKIIVPDQNTRIKTFDIFESLFRQEIILKVINENLCRTRDLLLPKLISGELDVEDLDIAVGGGD